MRIIYVTSEGVAPVLDRERLRRLGDYTEYSDADLKREGAVPLLKDAEILMCGTNWITPELIAACPRLKLVVMRATGFNTVDLSCTAGRDITICNNPLYATVPVAQHAAALLLSLTNLITAFDGDIRKDGWKAVKDRSLQQYKMMELYGKTLGIIGFGRIGQEAARLLKPFGMRVLACDPYPNESGRALGEYVSLDTLLAEADVISLHCPLTEENHHLIDRERIAQMKDGAVIINVSRGKLIDEAALAEALHSGKVRAAGLDVMEQEPPADSPLLDAPNCILTPHVAWMAPESRKRMADCMIDTAEAWLAGRPINVLVSPEKPWKGGARV